MADFCLIPEQVDKFKQAVINGEINPDILSNASSEERRKLLAKIVGDDNALGVNSLFESKLLLKDQQAGFIRWAEKLTGVTKAQRRDIVSRIEKLDKVLSTAETDNFLSDLAATKLGINVTAEEAQQIAKLAKEASALRDKGGKEYGRAVLDLQEYTDELKPTKNESVATRVGGTMKSFQATADLSAPFRQGRDYFGSKEWFGAFKRMFDYATNPKAYRDLNAEIIGHKLYEKADKAGLSFTSIGGSISKKEEQFISNWAEKIPVIGKVIAGSERAYAGFLTDLRWNRFKNITENLEKAGIDLGKDEAAELAGVINSATGRGNIGTLERSSQALSEAIWSPKLVKSRLDLFLNLKAYTTYSKAARIEQWQRLGRMVGTTSAILGLASMAGAEVTSDMTSADFGKIKVGNRRFDVSGGYGSVLRLGARLYKKAMEGESGQYGEKTIVDILSDFATQKGSPLASTILDLASGRDFEGHNLRTPGATQRYLATKLIPLMVQDVVEAYQKGGLSSALTTAVPAAFGVSVQDYGGENVKTEEALTDTSNLSLLTKITGFPKPKPKAELNPIIDRLNAENVSINLPTSKTEIKLPGQDSQPITGDNLKTYKGLYQKYMVEQLENEKDSLLNLPPDVFVKRMNSIKRSTTSRAKSELIRKLTQ